MTSGQTPWYPSTRERTNYARLCRAVIDLSSQVLRDLLTFHVKPQDLSLKATNCPGHLQLSPTQWLLIQNATSHCYAEFDISLLYTLLRKVCLNLQPPTRGWGSTTAPSLQEISEGDDVERIRFIKNKLYSHICNTPVSDAHLQHYWQVLEDVMLRMESRLNVEYTHQLHFIQSSCMDCESEKLYIKRIEEMKISEEELWKKVKDLDDIVKKTRLDLEKIKKDENDLKRTVEGLISSSDVLKGELERTDGTEIDPKTRIKCVDTCNVTRRADETGQHLNKEPVGEITENSPCFDESTEELMDIEAKRMKVNQGSRRQKSTEDVRNLSSILNEQSQNRHIVFLDSRRQDNHDTTLALVNKHSKSNCFLSTKAVEEGAKLLNEHGILIYKGKSGTGKTSNAMEVMKEMYDKHNGHLLLLNIGDVRKWEKYVNPSMKSIVLLDDVLGRSYYNRSLLDDSERYWRIIRACVDEGKVKVIMTIRSYIFDMNQYAVKDNDVFNNLHIIDLSGGRFKLSLKEKQTILELHCRKNMIDLYINKDDIIRTEPFMGYPQSCFLFCTNRNNVKLGVKFFKHPSKSLIREFDNLRKSEKLLEKLQYCIMVYLVLKGCSTWYSIDIDKLDTEMIERVIKAVELPQVPSKLQITDTIDDMTDKYIVQKDVSKYIFQHQSIIEAVAVSFSKCNLGMLLQFSEERFIFEFVRTEGYVPQEGEIILNLTEKDYKYLINSFLYRVQVCFDNFHRWENWFDYFKKCDKHFIKSLRDKVIHDETCQKLAAERTPACDWFFFTDMMHWLQNLK